MEILNRIWRVYYKKVEDKRIIKDDYVIFYGFITDEMVEDNYTNNKVPMIVGEFFDILQ